MFMLDKVRDADQIQLIIANIINPQWTPWQYNLHWLVIVFSLLTRLILIIWYTNIYKLMFVK